MSLVCSPGKHRSGGADRAVYSRGVGSRLDRRKPVLGRKQSRPDRGGATQRQLPTDTYRRRNGVSSGHRSRPPIWVSNCLLCSLNTM